MEPSFFGLELGVGKGDAALGFGVSGLNLFGDSGITSKTVEGDQMGSSGECISNNLGIDI